MKAWKDCTMKKRMVSLEAAKEMRVLGPFREDPRGRCLLRGREALHMLEP